ncbi:MAG: HlyD family secretion protein [Gammaproteobacteria bacterium]|nr:HlyD family secretion protein [Gammaproteobacteria bacterium]
MAAQRANLTFQVGGVLNRGELLVGQPVEQGAVLASVYNPELQPALASAQARLNELRSQSEQATREAERAETLYQRGVISAQQREQLESTAASLRAALQNAQAGVRQTNGQAVFRVRDGRAEQLPVQISAMRGEWAMLVTDDLQADDQVVYAGLSRLLDGDRVEVRP